MNVTVITHIGPLTTQIRDNDTVQSFIYELQEAVGQRMQHMAPPAWHFLTHKSRILKPQTLLSDVIKSPGDELVYVHPIHAQSSEPREVKSAPVKPAPAKTNSSSVPVPVPVPISSAPPAMPPSPPAQPTSPSLPPTGYFKGDDLTGLQSMGFSELRAKQALLMFEGKFEPALDWLLGLANPDDSEPLSTEDQGLFDQALAKYLQSHD